MAASDRRWLLCLALLTAGVACESGTGPATNPIPVITAVSPDSLPFGSPATLVTVTGHDFQPLAEIQVDRVGRATNFIDATTLTTTFTAEELAMPGVVYVSVHNKPSAENSAQLPLRIIALKPFIQDLLPASVTVGQPSLILSVIGQGFQPGVVVSWDGVDRPTAVQDVGRLAAVLDSADLAVAGQHTVRVRQQLAPFDSSAPKQFTIQNPRPRMIRTAPRFSTAGHADFTLTVDGTGFVPGAVLSWNSAPQPTTFVSPTRLTVAISAGAVVAAGSATLQVQNPDPAEAPSLPRSFVIDAAGRHVLPLDVGGFLWDPVRQQLYVSILATDSIYPNRLIALDPMTGEVVRSVFVGSNPTQLAISDDASVLYVALDGAAAIRRVDLATFTAGLQFPVGLSGSTTVLYANDIEVRPGHPETIAITLQGHGFNAWGPMAEVQMYDDGVPRKLSTWSGATIEFTGPDTLYGGGTGGSESRIGVMRLVVTDSGAVYDSSASDLPGVWGGDFDYLDGSMFTAGGGVVDLPQMRARGPLAESGFIGVDESTHRVFYLPDTTLTAVDASTLQVLGTERISGVPAISQPYYYWLPRPLARWGSDGFAYRGVGGLVIFRSNLALP